MSLSVSPLTISSWSLSQLTIYEIDPEVYGPFPINRIVEGYEER